MEGIKSVSEKELSETLVAKMPPWWKFWVPKIIITPDDLEDDLLRIKQFYRRYGYYNTEATFKIKKLKNQGAAYVTYTITEGQPVCIETIDIRSARKIEGISEQNLLNLLTIQTGQIFETGKYRESKRVLQKALGNKGYPFAKISGQVVVNIIDNQADIIFDLDPGQKHTFGSIFILDNNGYLKESVIHRALSFKPGETYSSNKVTKSQHNLFDLGIFKVALIKPGEPVPDNPALPMTVLLKPKKRQNIKFGLGYGNEDGFRLKGAWTYRNLFGWAGNLTLSARRSDLIENAQLEYLQPYFLDNKNILESKAGFERETFESHTNLKAFGNIALNRNLTKNWTWMGGYNLEINRLEDLDITDPSELEQFQIEDDYLISSVETGVARDTIDSDIKPARGSFVSVFFEQASSTFGSEIDYFKPVLEIKKYQSLSEKMVLAARIRLQTIQDTEDTDHIPIFKRFFLGGSNTVRGYAFQKLGPLDANGNPLGGLTSGNANLELRYPIYKKISGVVFMDMGVLDEESFRYNLSEIRYSCGAGLRYNTIIGPIRLDCGYKLNPRNEIEDRWRIHLSIGQTF